MKKIKSRKIQLRVTEQFWDDLLMLSRVFNTTKSQYITEIVSSAMKRQNQKSQGFGKWQIRVNQNRAS
jgi:predicted DNA-binding ribbon-helix-helix protein